MLDDELSTFTPVNGKIGVLQCIHIQMHGISAMGDVKTTEGAYSFTIIEEPLYSNTVSATMSMTGDISLFRGENTLFYNNLPTDKMRFLCLERVTLRIDFENSAMPDNVTFFPIGGNPVSSKVIVTSPGKGYAQYNYTLVILPSTLNWENRRINNPYFAYTYMYINNQPMYLTLGGIEITGSIHDLVYIQGNIRN